MSYQTENTSPESFPSMLVVLLPILLFYISFIVIHSLISDVVLKSWVDVMFSVLFENNVVIHDT